MRWYEGPVLIAVGTLTAVGLAADVIRLSTGPESSPCQGPRDGGLGAARPRNRVPVRGSTCPFPRAKAPRAAAYDQPIPRFIQGLGVFPVGRQSGDRVHLDPGGL